ncbi:hypothetical protein [Streptomyces sp. OR43]|uniref:hypothetical protein n=1 Tax=Streptomyces sp. or43 TaxID=2478957 RepID=UPI0011CEAEDE|nr:hypothetical protein [Streptomyces sp. or43]TXS38006.1 hypothetical protein EAO72_32760 [Streptomyces sp. or43]
MNDVRELLGRAAEEAGRPAISTEEVYARAARVRRRRRVAVSAAAVCTVAAGAFVVPGISAGGEQAPRKSSVAAPAKPVGNTERATALIKLLPEGVGAVEEVSMSDILKDGMPEAEVPPSGPLDGLYAVRRGGGVGFLVIGGSPRTHDRCTPTTGVLSRPDCVREELPDGRVLTIWSGPSEGVHSFIQWGPQLLAVLTLADGRQVTVSDSTGFEAYATLGPQLKTPPLTRAQLRTLMLRPELLTEK